MTRWRLWRARHGSGRWPQRRLRRRASRSSWCGAAEEEWGGAGRAREGLTGRRAKEGGGARAERVGEGRGRGRRRLLGRERVGGGRATDRGRRRGGRGDGPHGSAMAAEDAAGEVREPDGGVEFRRWGGAARGWWRRGFEMRGRVRAMGARRGGTGAGPGWVRCVHCVVVACVGVAWCCVRVCTVRVAATRVSWRVWLGGVLG